MRAVLGAFVVGLLLLGIGVGGVVFGQRAASPRPPAETIYVVNKDPQDFSNAKIQRDIPAWEQAANQDFAPIWHTPQVRIELTTRAPRNGIVVDVVKEGPVRGALAYHTVTNGEPKIVDYAGVNNFYGYSNSVSITHELFETLGDPYTSALNQGYPEAFIYAGHQQAAMPPDSFWIQEVSDPVEAFSYRLDGVSISDFVTPNWWNDQVAGEYDYMHLVGAPYTVLTGGYAAYESGGEWFSVQNFRHAGRDAAGYYKAERKAR